jgi:hypothetical protein
MAVESKDQQAGQLNSAPPPLLFHHIPKTAGTSLNTLLGNIFGDSNFIHLTVVDDTTPAYLAALLDRPAGPPACISGHIPLHRTAAISQRITGFTFLREPVDRLLSLFKFSRKLPTQRYAHVGLPENYSLADFLASRHPLTIRHTDNGMCRFLCGLPQYSDPSQDIFWNCNDDTELLNAAIDNLDRLVFGIFERLEESLALLGKSFAIPFALAMPHENSSGAYEDAAEPALIARIIQRNTLDLCLYREAQRRFAQRLAAPPAVAYDYEDKTVFRPAAGGQYPVAGIPGRFGFFGAETGGFAWLHSQVPTRIFFAASPGLSAFTLHAITVTPDYPLAGLTAMLNGAPLPVAVAAPDGLGRRLVHIGPFTAGPGVNVLGLTVPAFIPVRSIHPGSLDDRALGVAIFRIDAV